MAYTRNKRKTFWHVNRPFFSGSICFNHLVISFFSFMHVCFFIPSLILYCNYSCIYFYALLCMLLIYFDSCLFHVCCMFCYTNVSLVPTYCCIFLCDLPIIFSMFSLFVFFVVHFRFLKWTNKRNLWTHGFFQIFCMTFSVVSCEPPEDADSGILWQFHLGNFEKSHLLEDTRR